MKKWWLLLVLLICWLGAGAAMFDRDFSGPAKGNAVKASPQRIVSLAPNLTEILFALGLDEKIAAVTQFSSYPEAALNKPRVGTFWQPNLEAIISAGTDLVVTLGFDQQKSTARRLGRIGIDTLTVDINKVDDLYAAIKAIGRATGKANQARELADGIKGRVSELSAKVGDSEKVRVLWVVQREPLMVAGRGTFINEMIELAGGRNAIGETIHQYPAIGAEQIISCGADVIIEASMWSDDLEGQRARAMEYYGKFRQVPAVENGRIYVINGDTVSRLGPRLYESVETIAKCLRPEVFGNER